MNSDTGAGDREQRADGTARARGKMLPPPRFERDTAIWWLTTIVGVAFAIYIVAYAHLRFVPVRVHTIIMVGIGIIVYLLVSTLESDLEGSRYRLYAAVSILLSLVTVGITYYFVTGFREILNRLLTYTELEYALALILLLLILEVTRRSYGWALVIVPLIGVVYAFFGPYLPSFLAHEGVGSFRIIELTVLTFNEGAYGFLPQVAATWVAIFLVLAGLLEGYGAMELFLKVSTLVSDRSRSGVAQLSVITSFLMGSISGSAAANTATTGSFTIPLMKRAGLKGKVAGGIESAASSGGQIMPPVMGAAAFVMAAILGLPYIEIVAIGLLPAVLFYTSIAISTHIVCLKEGVEKGVDKDAIDTDRRLLSGIPFLVAIGALVYYLGVARYGPMTSAVNSIVALVITQFAWALYAAESMTAAIKDTTLQTIRGLQIGAITTAPFLAVIAAVAVFVKLIGTGGLTQFLTFTMFDFSGGSLLLLLFMAMILAILFGMGMPTVAAYIIVAVLLGPTIAQLGVAPVYGHMFAFYFAIMSAITPPVAVAVIVATGIAESDFFATAIEAMKVGIPGFILPYSFVIHPSLLQWSPETIPAFGLVLLGLVGMTATVQGYFTEHLSVVHRLVIVVGGVGILFVNDPLVNGAGAIVVAGVLAAIAFADRIPFTEATN